MAKSRREFILFTCFTSGLAVVLTLAALGTEQWIVAEGYFTESTISDQVAYIKYGLFTGIIDQKISGLSTAYEIRMTCNYKENACAVLCKNTAAERSEELKQLLSNANVDFDFRCPQVQRTLKAKTYDVRGKFRSGIDRTFITAGSYMSTLVFLGLSAAFGLLSTILSVLNTGGNPVQAYFNILGLYIYNACAAFFSLMVLCVWGTEQVVKLIDNVAVLYTITGAIDTKGRGQLGFSYWLNIGAFVLYGVSISLFWFRQRVIEREPEVKMDIEDIDENIILY